jgi:large subunit ribosomal protein L15
MNIGDLNIPKKKNRRRVGRGTGSGNGTTAGRGMNGQRSRSGFKRRPWFEGGQMPLQRRVPKRGFNSRNRIEFQLVNVASLERFDNDQTIDPEFMQANGLIKHADRPVKVLGNGDLSKKLTVTADKFSQSAMDKISNAGGAANLRQSSPNEDAA